MKFEMKTDNLVNVIFNQHLSLGIYYCLTLVNVYMRGSRKFFSEGVHFLRFLVD